MPSAAKLTTELIGTFVFLAVISMGASPLFIGLALAAMVYMGGHVSGAHYNPAVSLGVFLRGKLTATELGAYWAAQLVGGISAFAFGHLVGGRAAGIHPGEHVANGSALAVEVVFTAALVLVVLNVAATVATAGNSFYGMAIGFTVAAAAFAGGPISGGAFNPAVGLGATFSGAVYGSGDWSSLWLYIVGPFLGAAIGAGIHHVQTGGTATVEE